MSDLLSAADRGKLLNRLDLAAAPPSESFLARLQRAWCFAQPFHNLDILASQSSGGASLSPKEAVARCVAGLGGPCHVQSLGFLLLLQSLGFDAHLCGATIAHPDDHLVVRVALRERILYCDVGNGQPFLQPFPASHTVRQEHLGWVVTSSPQAAGIVVERSSQDQPAPRVVYRASPIPRCWSDFEEAVRRHHSEPDFGPFLTGLRVVRIGAEEMWTVRDMVRTRYLAGCFERSVMSSRELVSFIAGDLGLQELPVEDAVRVFCEVRRRA